MSVLHLSFLKNEGHGYSEKGVLVRGAKEKDDKLCCFLGAKEKLSVKGKDRLEQ